MLSARPTLGARVQEILRDVVVEYPSPTYQNQTYEIIRFKMTPLSAEDKVAIARAIAARQNMQLLPDGGLMPQVQGAVRPLVSSVERRIAHLVAQQYEIEIHLEAGREQPRIFCLSPVINGETRPRNRHLYVHRHPDQPEVQALCVYGPHEVDWQPMSGDPYHLLVWLATYLACDAIQVAVNQWLGKESSHSLSDIQRKHGEGKCWCGSGRQIQSCHGNRPIVSLAPRRLRSTQ